MMDAWLRLLLMSALLTGCHALPPRPATPMTISSTPTTLPVPVLAKRTAQDVIYPLIDPLEAYAVRVKLIRRAQHSIDLAYYIWGNDLTGHLMLDELKRAAERGVRVRLLLDDNNSKGLDPLLLALSHPPNFEIRVFNPMRYRKLRLLNYMADLGRTQRRMHGKIFTIDQSATIIGGRNIADPYYRVTDEYFFADLDVLAVGGMLPAANAHFERFWHDPLSYPVQGFLHASPQTQQRALDQMFDLDELVRAQPYLQAILDNRTLDQLIAQQDTATEANADAHRMLTQAVLVSDWPFKISRTIPFEQTIGAQIQAISGTAQHHLLMITPYFVPQAQGTAQLIALAQQGVKIKVLTNSLAATDVPALHSFYARYRVALLKAGVELYEFKPSADNRPIKRWRIRERFGRKSAGSLHAKAISWDGQLTFVGSMNIDPRSVMINTELGLMIRGAEMPKQIAAVFDQGILNIAYRVSLDGQGRLQWIERNDDDQLIIHRTEPAPNYRKVSSALTAWLPIEHLM